MSIVNKLLAIPNYYRTINPSTLSGSCDIIVIRDSNNVLRCTNFHIRFGKKHIFRLKECNITMFVNEEHCPLNLKLGKQGEVLFETETEEVVATKCSFESDAQIFKKYNLDITRKVVKNKEMANVKLVNAIGKMTVKENSNSPKSDTSVGNSEKHLSSSEEALGSSSNEFKEFYSHKNSRLGNDRKENTNDQSPRQISQVQDSKTTNLLPKSSSETNKDAKSTACDECPDSSSISEINNKKPELQRTPMEKEELTYIRYKYREKRMFLYRKKYFDYSENSKKQKTFYNIFRSTEHCEYITKTHAKLYSLLSGLINPRPKQDSDSACCENKRCCLKNCQATENTGCVGSLLSFSLCLKTKIENGDFTKTFENFRSRSLENYNNLVVRIEGCKMCKIEYFLPFELFTEFFFYLRTLMFSENSSRNRKFMEYVQKRIFECYNYTSPKKEAHEYSTTLSDNQLKKLKLKDGRNTLLFKIDGTSQQLYADCFLWNDDVRLIVSDIDGTITKSDAWGHVYTMMGKDWTHNGVAELFTKITRNTYKIIYLSSRPFSQIDYTKKYLFNISQNGYKLPVGPVLLSPNGIFGAIYREIILRNPQKFKIACLFDVRNLFKHNPFVSGFGNRKTDIITYYTLGIPKGKIFIIDPKGRLCEDRIEKKNYETLNALVENVFPPIKQSCYVNNEVQWWMFSTKK